MVDEDIIREVIDEIFDDIKLCAVITGLRPREDCRTSCQYRDICNKIFDR